jgi:hypothetical protein
MWFDKLTIQQFDRKAGSSSQDWGLVRHSRSGDGGTSVSQIEEKFKNDKNAQIRAAPICDYPRPSVAANAFPKGTCRELAIGRV